MFWELLSLVLLTCLWLYLRSQQRPRNYPPGPWGLPFLGHLLHLGDTPHLTLCTTLKEKYGPVVAVDFGSFPAVGISDFAILKDVLADSNCIGRPELEPFRIRSGGKRRGILFSDGEQWKEQRRFALKQLKDLGLGRGTIESVALTEVKEVIRTVKKNVGHPLSTKFLFNAAVVNVLWMFITGERFQHDDAVMQDLCRRLRENLEEHNGIAALGMFLPWLTNQFPTLLKFDKMMADLEPMLNFLRKPMYAHMATYQPGVIRDFLDVYIKKIKDTTDPNSSFYQNIGEQSMLTVLLDFFTAGTETTSTTLQWALLYLAVHPEAQEKLHNEIDKVIGQSRNPALSDECNMPYTQAVIHETLRHSCLVPVGIFRNTLGPCKIGKYDVPKDTMLLVNMYAVHRDPMYWDNPDEFQPERWLDSEGAFTKKEAFFPFSAGKRFCIGESMARNQLFIFMASLFQRLKVSLDPSYPLESLDPIVTFVLLPPKHELLFTLRD